jgi:hypothetical protein
MQVISTIATCRPKRPSTSSKRVIYLSYTQIREEPLGRLPHLYTFIIWIRPISAAADRSAKQVICLYDDLNVGSHGIIDIYL